MYFRLYTLGCKVNQYETELFREGLRRLGYSEAPARIPTDFVLINTCTVTSESDQKSRKTIRKAIKENPSARIVVMGCSATRDREGLARIHGISDIITDKQDIPRFLHEMGLNDIPTGISAFGERHRAYVKVQDGCRVGCSYCIIPKVRPVLRSRPPEKVLEEIRRLSEQGYHEIVLTGIHLGHYGVDFTDRLQASTKNLSELVHRIVDLPEYFRLRISSLEAIEVSDELIDLMLRYPDRICPHLHLSMQSGSNEVLKRMKRRWMREPFIRRCEEILARFDRLALTTDVIVGFPSETDAQFEETCQTVRQLRFSKVHIFRFSPRQGTEASTMPDQVPVSVQKNRADHLNKIADELRKQFAESLIDRTVSVLLESEQRGTADLYLDVQLDKKISPDQVGQLLRIRINHFEKDFLIGSLHDFNS